MKKTTLFSALCAALIVITAGCGVQTSDSSGEDAFLPQNSGSVNSDSSDKSDSSDSGNSGNSAQRIGLEDAMSAALKHAGLTGEQITLIHSKLERDNGVEEYDIEFTANGMRYEYEINAQSGEIIEFSAEKMPVGNSNSETNSGENSESQTAEKITESQAKDIAVKHAGVSANQVSFIKSKLDFDNGAYHYDIEFTANGTRYEYEINAQSGAVIEFEAEKMPTGNSGSGTSLGSQTAEKITESQAKDIAVKHAGVSASQVSFIKSKLEFDDGVYHYDIEFTANGTRYEYEINAQSGAVIEFEAEKMPIGNTNSGTNSGSQTAEKITESQAKDIAVKHAGFSANQVSFIKSKLDYDNGAYHYDIEFTANGTRYEYEINAQSGVVIEFETEKMPSGNTGTNPGSQTAEKITESQAKDIAIKHAGFSVNQVSFIKSELDYDHGVWEYEIEFIANSREYEYKINAVTGAVIEWESEHSDHH